MKLFSVHPFAETSTSLESLESNVETQLPSRLPIWLEVAAIFVSALLLFGAPLNTRGFFTRGEAREALVVQAMVEQGSYLLPLRNGSDIPSKPPFFHWQGALFSQISGGLNEGAIRFPSAFWSAISLAALYLFAARQLDRSIAVLAVLILAASFEWSRSATHSRVDMSFAGTLSCAAFALFSMLERWKCRTPIPWQLSLITGVLIGLAALSKGPAALLLLGAIAAGFVLIANKSDLVGLLRSVPYRGLACAGLLGIGLPAVWYFLAYLQGGNAFIETQLLKENLARVVPNGEFHVGHEKPFYYVFIHLLVGFLPWSLLFPVTASWMWKKRKKPLSNAMLFCLVWAAVFITAVGLSVSKRVVYLLPAYPAFALLLAASLCSFDLPDRVSRWSVATFRWLSAVFAGLLACCALVLVLLRISLLSDMLLKTFFPGDAAAIQVINALHRGFLPTTVFLLLAAGSSIFAARAYRLTGLPKGCQLLALGVVLLGVSIQTGVLPVLASVHSPKQFMNSVQSVLPSGTTLGQFKDDYYAADYYAGQIVRTVKNNDPALQTPLYLLTTATNIPELHKAGLNTEILLESKLPVAHKREKLLLIKTTPPSAETTHGTQEQL